MTYDQEVATLVEKIRNGTNDEIGGGRSIIILDDREDVDRILVALDRGVSFYMINREAEGSSR